VAQVDQLDVEVFAGSQLLVDPMGRPLAETAFAGGAGDDLFDILPRLKAGDSSYYADWSSR
jgi:hypothetical protein